MVIADGFSCFAWSSSYFDCACWTTSIIRTDQVWIWNIVVTKGTNYVSFFHAFENWNSSISNWFLLDLDQINPGHIKLFVEMVLEQVLKLVTIKTQQNNQHITYIFKVCTFFHLLSIIKCFIDISYFLDRIYIFIVPIPIELELY